MKLETRVADVRDVPELKRMIDEYLAVDYYSLEELEACVQGERSLFYVVTDADRDGVMAAFFYAVLAPLEEALELLHVRKRPEFLKGYAPDTLVGVYKTASTTRDYREHGLCTFFVRELEPIMRERGAKLIVATAWRTPEGVVPMRRILHDAGFEAVEEIKRLWNDLDMFCTGCKRRHCICDAVFYAKRLDGTEDEDVRQS